MSVNDMVASIIKSISEAGPKTLEAIDRLFPGIAERSKANAASHEVHMTLSDMEMLMRASKQMGLSPEMQTTFANMLFERHGSNQRVAECALHALPAIEENGDPYGVDDEWLDYWRIHAGMARAEDMQAMWGAVLAGEVNRPGAVSKRAMSILSDMNSEDAAALKDFCSKCILLTSEDISIPVWPCPSEGGIPKDVSETLHIPASTLARLEAIGLMHAPLLNHRFLFDGTDRLTVEGKVVSVERQSSMPESSRVMQSGSIYFALTYFGTELAAFCEIGTVKDMREEVDKVFRAYGMFLTDTTEFEN